MAEIFKSPAGSMLESLPPNIGPPVNLAALGTDQGSAGLIVARTLMYLQGLGGDAAIALVRERRPGALSNDHFVAWLKQETP